jgi:putative tricarboxylic transport membrane protein
MQVFVKLLSVSKAVLMPTILVLCCVGAFSNGNNAFDIVMLGVFGVLGMILQKAEFPITPLIIGYIIGPMCELNLRRALVLGDGQVSYLFSSWIAIFFYAVTLLSIALAVRKSIRASRAARATGEVAKDEEEEI